MERKEVTLRCVCHAECLVFSVNDYDSDRYKPDYDFSIEDSYCVGSGYTGFFGRLKRAWKAFVGKPICYSGVYSEDKVLVKKWLEDCLALVDSVGDGESDV